jgi:hypothetical protein
MQECLQAVVIASLTTERVEQAIISIEANKHVLCEKPVLHERRNNKSRLPSNHLSGPHEKNNPQSRSVVDARKEDPIRKTFAVSSAASTLPIATPCQRLTLAS